MTILSRISVAAIVICLLSLSAFPQAADSPCAQLSGEKKRPTIGVALEGGGALGLAHIGVLQWFEANKVPVDCIAGTSMGGLVAGLYAIGKTPEELKAIVLKLDWDAVIDGRTDYPDLSFRRKGDDRAFSNRVEIGLKHRHFLPPGLSTGQGVGLLIDRETLPYAHNISFDDDLPIPFRCVATNLLTGRTKVFDRGSIAQAMRSTMSIPGVFAPVRDGNSVYVDGGLLDNLPTDVVRAMGADVVIAVHLDIAPADAQNVQSLIDALQRSVAVVIQQNEENGIVDADRVVNVDLKFFTSLDYKEAGAIIERGEVAAAAEEDILAPYKLLPNDWDAYKARRDKRVKSIKSNFDLLKYVHVEGTDSKSREEIKRFLQPLIDTPVCRLQLAQKVRVTDPKSCAELGHLSQSKAKPVSTPTMAENLFNQLTGTGRYDSVDYWLTDSEGQTGLVVFVQEKGYAPPVLQIGSETDGSESKDVTFTQGDRLTFMNIAGYRSEWRTDFTFGGTYGISTELYRPFTSLGKWFFAPHIGASNTGVRFFTQTDPTAFYRFHQEDGGLDVGYGFNRFTELRVGYQIGYSDPHLNLGKSSFASLSGRMGDSHIRFRIDHTNDSTVPSKGYSADAEFRWYDAYPGAADGLPVIDAHLRSFHPVSKNPVSKRGSVFATAEGGTTFGFHNTGFPVFFLGAPLRLSAYGTNELFGQQYYLFRAGYLHEFPTRLPALIAKKAYIFGAYELGKMYGFSSESKFPTDVAAGAVAETFLGPLFIGGSIGDSGHQKWFFQLGRVF